MSKVQLKVRSPHKNKTRHRSQVELAVPVVPPNNNVFDIPRKTLWQRNLSYHAETQLEEFGIWEYASNYLPAISTVSHTSTSLKLQSVFSDKATSF